MPALSAVATPKIMVMPVPALMPAHVLKLKSRYTRYVCVYVCVWSSSVNGEGSVSVQVDGTFTTSQVDATTTAKPRV